MVHVVEPTFHEHPSLESLLYLGALAAIFSLGLGVLFSLTMTLCMNFILHTKSHSDHYLCDLLYYVMLITSY
jgi:hypothetical protein